MATFNPSIALRTEMAGVIMPSVKKRSSKHAQNHYHRPRVCLAPGWSRAIKARIPPSPRLSMRITYMMYLIETTMRRDQNMSESTPSTISGVGEIGCCPPKHSRSAKERIRADVTIDYAKG